MGCKQIQQAHCKHYIKIEGWVREGKYHGMCVLCGEETTYPRISDMESGHVFAGNFVTAQNMQNSKRANRDKKR